MSWSALSPEEVRQRVHAALDHNRSYRARDILGLPGTLLDPKVFPATPEVMRRPWLRTTVENPNHIGCHTLGDSEPAFQGTHDLEREAIALCAEHIFSAAPGTVDGYIATGGTESNIQAMWAFRNHWRDAGVPIDHMAIVCTEDTHYSLHKAADLLGLPIVLMAVEPNTRALTAPAAADAVARLQALGCTHALVAFTMGTTMFGTVDDPDPLLHALDAAHIAHMVHVDAAFGGFIYPFTHPRPPLTFADPRVHTVTLDAHKMLQAPYGTGIHLARKGLLAHTTTRTAAYVPGLDCTLSGSRSGANAIAVWMILQTWGSAEGTRFVTELADRAARLADALRARGHHPLHTPGMNIVVLPEAEVPAEISERYLLVADDHHHPKWRKVVVMEHVTDQALDAFLADLCG